VFPAFGILQDVHFWSYTITAIGIILAVNTIGLQWAKLQWLIAPLGVGLCFGLQEIVANFICGLIVLFERSFRVGDTVTVGETSGMVSRIRILATTITDLDRRELIVPNKEFLSFQNGVSGIKGHCACSPWIVLP
jgi:potassium efflux system protein